MSVEEKVGLLKPTIQITLFSVLNIFLSFISQLVIAYYYGTSSERDSYFAAVIIPTYITSVFTGSIGYMFLPKVVELKDSSPVNVLDEFLSSTFFFLLLILSIITMIGVIFPRIIIHFTAPGFDPVKSELTAKLLQIVLPTSIFSTMVNLLASLYQVKYRFIRPSIAPIFVPVVTIISVILLSNKIGIYSISIGALSGSILSFFFLIGIIKKIKIKISFVNSDVNGLLKVSLPLLVSGIIFRSTTLIERMIASGLSEGSISYLGYANQILTILATITSTGIAVSIFPLLSKYWVDKEFIKINDILIKSFKFILILGFPIIIIFFFWGNIIVKIIFERGAFSKEATYAVSKALLFFMGAFVFQSLGSVIIKIFYISKRTITISIIGIIELLIYLILGFYFTKYYSYVGLAIALSIGSMLNIIISVIYIDNKLIKIQYKYVLIDGFKILLAALLSISLSYIIFVNNFLNVNEILYFGICLIVAIILYLILGLLFKVEELNYISKFLIKINWPWLKR